MPKYLLTETLKKIKYLRTTPSNAKLEDIYLVSFPKSGNTWLRFLIANAFKVHLNILREVNFFSIHDIIPDVELSRYIRDIGIFGNPQLPRIIKSHSTYNPYYHRVILLVRDPRDAVISYYYYLRNYKAISKNLTFSEFLSNKKYGAPAWDLHTQAWFQAFGSNHNVQIILYEDLISNASSSLSKLMQAIGYKLSEDELESAVKLSSKDNMRMSELQHRSFLAVRSQETPFVRKAQSSQGQDISDIDRKKIEDLTQASAQLLGYNFQL